MIARAQVWCTPLWLRPALLAAAWLSLGSMPVYDAASHVEGMRRTTLLTELLQRHDAELLPGLRELLQVEHQQYDAWRDFLQRLGTPSGAAPDAGGGQGNGALLPSGGGDTGLRFSWGMFGEGDPEWSPVLGRLVDGRGALTIYGELGAGAWRELVLGSWRRWAEQARDAWLGELGAAAGWSDAEMAFAQWLVALGPGEIRARREEVARGLARLATERWLETADTRRDRLAALAAVAERQRVEAQRPATVLEALVQANEAAAQATTTLVEGWRIQAETAEASLLGQRALLEEAVEAARRARRERALEWANLDAP